MNRNQFDAKSTGDEVLNGVDLTGKTVLITGGSSGLGAETARLMAAHGAEVFITARNPSQASATLVKIKDATGKAIEVGELELGSIASIRKFSEAFVASHPKLDLLVNNAGVMASPESKTEDGFELQFGTNHIGHFLLTCLLAPALINGAPSRVVNLSSVGHRLSPVVFDDVNYESREYNKWTSYGQAKTANVLFTVGLEKRLASKGVHSYAVHPGTIRTKLIRHMTAEELESMGAASPSKTKTLDEGIATIVFAATSTELEGRGGVYLSDCQICPVDDASNTQNMVRSFAVDADNADRLWALSEDMVGQRFVF